MTATPAEIRATAHRLGLFPCALTDDAPSFGAWADRVLMAAMTARRTDEHADKDFSAAVGEANRYSGNRHLRLGQRTGEVILWEGPCAYVANTGERYEIIVFSSNYVTHKPAGITDDGARAEIICRRLNAYPRQTRTAYGLL